MKFSSLAINDPKYLIFSDAPKPLKTNRGLNIGGGFVYPEANFTLPPMEVSMNTLTEVKRHHTEIVEGILKRAVELNNNGRILELETVIEMTKIPEIGVELVKIMNDICERYYQDHKLPTEIRLTPNDLREFDRPPRARTSSYPDAMFKLFDQGARAGGNLLSI